ncbi:hypothetical protein BU25DRAFT_213154 [Macroventuria anomochaeta]|uniref:Uncharacterized protein n=1 Tax=Macroventuria anomochaeta TaxID=301207 RepID=A0ACB6RMS5_9PLEO|nr:uncharacterized protein BU25DRAFT_213154 [Macroventuria anomochaeta]KAF2622224.1 hypothetical protein BU25DRAFT_213154 [Macroventuria anomochaeta]
MPLVRIQTLPAQQPARHHGESSNNGVGGSFTANVGGGRPSKFLSRIAVAPQRLLVCTVPMHPSYA